MKKTIPRENEKRVTLFEIDGGCVAATSNIAVQFKKHVTHDEMKDTCKIFVSDQMRVEEPLWDDICKKLVRGLTAKATISVVLPVSRLREVLTGVESKLIRIDLLPELLKLHGEQTDFVDGPEYVYSRRNVGGVDALRITELDAPNGSGDSACIMGALRSKSEWFTDKTRKQESNAKKRARFQKIQARARGEKHGR